VQGSRGEGIFRSFPIGESSRSFWSEADCGEEIDREEDPWDVTASRDMISTCHNVTDTERHLRALAPTHQGHGAGQGFFPRPIIGFLGYPFVALL